MSEYKSIFYTSYPDIENLFSFTERLWTGWFFLFFAKGVRRAVWPLLSLSAHCRGAQAQGRLHTESLAQAYTVAQLVANGPTHLTFFSPVSHASAKAIGLLSVENASIAHNPKSSH